MNAGHARCRPGFAVWGVLAGWAGLFALGAAAPDESARILAKEGPVEHASHLVIAAAAAAWTFAAAASLRAPRPRPSGLAAVAALAWIILLEETDWGALYGFPWAADRLRELVERQNLHNSWGGHSYALFFAPLVGLFAAPFLPGSAGRAARDALGPGMPTRDDAAAFGLVVALSPLPAVVNAPWENHLDEACEPMAYSLILLVGGRAARGFVHRKRA